MKRAKKFSNGPALLTNFLFDQFVDTLSNCIACSPNVTTLALEGLPLHECYITNIAKVRYACLT